MITFSRFPYYAFPTHRIVVLLATLVLAAGATSQAQYTVLHTFAGSDGADPWGSLALAGSALYGTTQLGGANGDGVMFMINIDGSGYQVLHNFGSGYSDGTWPQGLPVLSGSTLYGMTDVGGGVNSAGTVYKINTDGSGYQVLHSFTGSGGSKPQGSLTLSGSTLYGMTFQGGANGNGTVFRMNADGTGFQVLRSFASGGSDGSTPYGSLTLSGSTIYGMTTAGGSGGKGTVFTMNIDGTGFQLLHSFASGSTDGSTPYGSLTLSGSTLYGMTYYGGLNSVGTAFKMNIDGTGFQILHNFGPGNVDGNTPEDSLTLSGSTLYGMTPFGGTDGNGTVFQMNTDGTAYQVLHNFAYGSPEGTEPFGSLTLDGSTLYGMTWQGGANGNGTVFSLTLIPEPGTWALLAGSLGGLFLLRRRPPA